MIEEDTKNKGMESCVERERRGKKKINTRCVGVKLGREVEFCGRAC